MCRAWQEHPVWSGNGGDGYKTGAGGADPETSYRSAFRTDRSDFRGNCPAKKTWEAAGTGTKKVEGKPGTVSEPSASNGGNTDAEGTGLTGYPNSSGTGRRGGLYSYGFETGCPEPGSRTQRTERENSLQSGACSGIYFSQADPFAEGTGAFSLQGKDQPAESGRSLP